MSSIDQHPKLVKLSEAPKVPFNLDGRVMFSSAKAEIIHLRLKPGEKNEKHTNPMDVIFYFIEGEGTMGYEEKEYPVCKDMSCFIPAQTDRYLSNTGDGVLRILVIKLPA